MPSGRIPLLTLLFLVATLPVQAAAQQPGSASLELTVTDAVTGEPIAGARVQLIDLGLGATTDAMGRAVVHDIPPGEHRLDVASFGYSPERAALLFVGGEAAEGEVAMRREIFSVDGVTVTAERQRSDRLEMRGFYDRQRFGMGRYMEREDIDRLDPFDTADLFRRMTGVRVSYGSRGNRYLLGRRAPATLQVGQYQMGCSMSVFVDGLPWYAPIDDLPVEWVAAIEVYPGGATVPIEYVGRSGGCGVVLIWTD